MRDSGNESGNESGLAWGGKLGTVNPADPCRTGRRKPRKAWRTKAKAPPPRPSLKLKASPRRTREELIAAHKAKMAAKHARKPTEKAS